MNLHILIVALNCK